MRKFTKILTVLLAVMLVFGIAAIVATADTEEAVYQIADKNGTVITTGTDAANIKTDISGALAANDEVYVKMLKDADLSAINALQVTAGKTLDFDFNGKKCYAFFTAYTVMFDMKGNGATLNVYSSQPGAELIKHDYHGDLFRGYAVARNNSKISCTVNFGNGTNNLAIHSPILFDVDHGASATNTGWTTNLNINGGLYSRAHGDSAGLIIARDILNISIKNATIVSTNGTLLATVVDRVDSKITATIDNSVIYGASPFFTKLQNSSSISITNSYIDAPTYNTTNANQAFVDDSSVVTLGNGTKYTDRVLDGGTMGTHFMTEEGATVFEDAANYTVAFDYYTGVYDSTKEGSAAFVMTAKNYSTLTTFNAVKVVTDADSVDVTFGESGDAVYATGKVFAGMSPAHPTISIGDIVMVSGAPKALAGWATTKGATEIENIVAVKGQALQVYPVWGQIAYEISNSEEVLKYGVDTANLITDYNALAPNHSELNIVLYSDFNLTSKNHTVIIPQGKSLVFDMNGCDITKFTTDGKSYVFDLRNANTSINLYSSKAGAEVKIAYFTGTAYNGTALVYAGNGNTNVTIGNGTDNITVYAPTVYDVYGVQHHGNNGAIAGAVANSNVATLNINGGVYISNNIDSLAQLTFRHTANATIKNATFIAPGNYKYGYSRVIVSFDDRFYINESNVTFEGCTLKSNIILGTFPEEITLTFNDCDLIGNILCNGNSQIIGNTTTVVHDGTLILGNGTKANFALHESIQLASGCVTFNRTTSAPLVWGNYEFKCDKDTKVWDESSLTTKINKTETIEYTVEILKESEVPKKVTVSWLDPYTSIPYYTEEYYPGEVAVFDRSYDDATRINGWLVEGIEGWSASPGSDEPASLVVSNSNRNFYAIYGTTVDVQAYYNFSTSTNFVGHVYLEQVEGIEITAVYEGNTTSGNNLVTYNKAYRFKEASINGVPHYDIIHWPAATNTGAQSYTVVFTYEGVEYTEYIKTTTIGEYFMRVVESEDTCEEAKILAVNAANYCQSIFTYTGMTNTMYQEILGKYPEYLISNTEINAGVEAQKLTGNYLGNLTNYVSGASFVIGTGYRPMFAFVPIDETVTQVNIAYMSGNGKTVNNRLTLNTPNSSGITNWGEPNTLLVNTADIGVYDIRSTLTVTSTDGEATGTYNLATYIAYLESLTELTEEETNALSVARALYAYSIASYNYKTRNAGK